MKILFNVVAAIGCAILCNHIAWRNGRNQKLAILWGIFLGPLAVLAYLLIGKKRETTNKQS